MFRAMLLAVCLLFLQGRMAFAQSRCQFYAQNPDTITVTDAQNIEREIEIDFRNDGATTWQNTGGVSNLDYIELRPVTSAGIVFDGPLYHANWINRQRVGSFLAIQQGVAPNQVARFVFKVQINGAALGVGMYDFYFRPYHASGGYINDWGQTKIRVVVTQSAPPPAPPSNPGPTTLSARIQSAVVERSVLNAGSGAGAYVERYDLIRSGAIPLRAYQTLQLQGSALNGTAINHEWSLVQNGATRLLGSTASLLTKPEDLFVGSQQLRYRAQDANGNWSSYDTFNLAVEFWPRLFVPVHGNFVRSGFDYGEGDHLGTRAMFAQDWNGIGGGNTDFGLELIAALSGTVSVGQYSDGGRYVNIEHADSSGARFRLEYMHLSSVLVRQGQVVTAGQPIGLFGNTGSASQLTHLHYVCSQWINGGWVSVAPEPCFIDNHTAKQVIRYNEVVQANTRLLPSTMVVLPEQAVSATNQDTFGYGGGKYWSSTMTALQPTTSCTWDWLATASGTWKLYMHNPSAVTNDNYGASTHNTTAGAVFEINRPRVLGLQTYKVDQAAAVKGSLVEVCEMDLQAGDRVLIRQHNATGESGREMSYDDLVLMLETAAGSGGAPGGGTGGGSLPSNPPQSPSAPAPIPSPSPSPTTPTNPGNPSSPFVPGMSGGGSGGGGGGCAIAAQGRESFHTWLLLFFLFLVIVYGRRRISASP